MKNRKIFTKLLFFVFLLGLSAGISTVNAQCVPDLSITSPGIIPDSATNMLPGVEGVAYSQIMQFKAPIDTVIIVGGFPVTAQIVSIQLTSLSGLPPGLTSSCVPASCIYPGGSNGCAAVTGIPTTAGNYPIVAILTTQVTIFGTPATQIDTIDYYFIDITAGVGIDEIQTNAELVLNQNVPNPVTDHTQITYYSSKDRILSLTIHDLLGSQVLTKKMEAQKGQNIFMLNLSSISSGIYLYSIGNDEVKATKRLVIAKE